jgi:hypothetical protein
VGFGGNRFWIGILFLFPQGARPFGRSLCTLGGRFVSFIALYPLRFVSAAIFADTKSAKADT